MNELICLRDELYGGSWPRMTRDLRQRLKEKFYIWRLAKKIKEDLKTIDKIRKGE